MFPVPMTRKDRRGGRGEDANELQLPLDRREHQIAACSAGALLCHAKVGCLNMPPELSALQGSHCARRSRQDAPLIYDSLITDPLSGYPSSYILALVRLSTRADNVQCTSSSARSCAPWRMSTLPIPATGQSTLSHHHLSSPRSMTCASRRPKTLSASRAPKRDKRSELHDHSTCTKRPGWPSHHSQSSVVSRQPSVGDRRDATVPMTLLVLLVFKLAWFCVLHAWHTTLHHCMARSWPLVVGSSIHAYAACTPLHARCHTAMHGAVHTDHTRWYGNAGSEDRGTSCRMSQIASLRDTWMDGRVRGFGFASRDRSASSRNLAASHVSTS